MIMDILRWIEASISEDIVNVVLSLNEQSQKLHSQEVATASYSHVQPTLATFNQIGDKLDEIDYLYQQGKLPIEASYYLINSPTNALATIYHCPKLS